MFQLRHKLQNCVSRKCFIASYLPSLNKWRNSRTTRLQISCQNCLFCVITWTLLIKHRKHIFSFSRYATLVIVPSLPDFSRRQKQYQSKYHHDRHFGPFFEDPLNTTGTLQVGFHQGTESTLNCRVGMLKDKTVIISVALCSPLEVLLPFICSISLTGYVGEENCR